MRNIVSQSYVAGGAAEGGITFLVNTLTDAGARVDAYYERYTVAFTHNIVRGPSGACNVVSFRREYKTLAGATRAAMAWVLRPLDGGCGRCFGAGCGYCAKKA